MTGHGVALAIITSPHGELTGHALLAQCECGARWTFAEVVTWSLVRSTIDAHHQSIRNGELEAGR